MQVTWPLLAAVAGALVYGFAPGKGAELGRLAYFAGLFWLLYSLAGHGLRF
jgi:hypothetical protein